jgi:hypothetical protein
MVTWKDHLNLLGYNTDTIQKNTKALPDASKEAGIEVNIEKSKYMLISTHQNAGKNHNIKIANRSFENTVQLKYFGLTVTNQNFIHEKVRSRLNLGNACYHSIPNILSSCLMPKNINMKICKTIIFHVVL